MSNIDTDGNRRTTSTSIPRCAASSFRLVSQVPASPSSVPGENTRKKFGRNESHSTSRKDSTSASTVSPATSKLSRSPSARPRSSRYSVATET